MKSRWSGVPAHGTASEVDSGWWIVERERTDNCNHYPLSTIHFLRGVLAAGLLAAMMVLAGTGVATGRPLPPRAMVVVNADDFAQLRAARQAVEAAGGVVQGMIPPSMLLVRLDPEADGLLTGQAGIRAIERGPMQAPVSSKTARGRREAKAERLARRAWNQRLRAKSPVAQRRPLTPGVLGVDVLEVPAGAPGDGDDDPPASGPGSRPSSTNTRYMCGDCVVTIFLTESDGSQEPSTEDWTEGEEAQVTAEIQEGLSWLSDLMNTTYNANVTFIYEWHYREPTKYEPISTYAAFPAGNAAAFEILQRNGYAGSTSGGRLFNAAKRVQYGADMAYLMFVADSTNDGDGYFTDGYIAYAYLGGPWVVQNYRNDGWGISRMDRITAHETGHIFGAADEYAASGCTASQRYGYLSVLNGNAETGGEGQTPSLMLDCGFAVNKWTAGQWGLHLPDTTNDGTPDCFQYDAGGTIRRDQLAYVSHTLDDDGIGASSGNGNGQAEAGETIELGATIQNDALVRMRTVVGTLSTSCPHVMIVDAVAAFGDVDYSGSQATASDRFAVVISPDAPECTATFTVELTTSQGWHFTFTIDVAVAGAPPDGEAPAVPTGLTVTGTGDSWAALAWNHNTEPDLDHYNLYRSDYEAFGYALLAQPAGNTVTDTTAQNGHTYYYKLSASDTTGNESAACAPVAAALADEPPDVTIFSPEDGHAFDHDEELDFSGTATDREDGSLSGEIIWTSSLQGQIGLGAGFSRTLQPGTHLITASVTDSGGNTDVATIAVTVHEPDGAPTVTITAPAGGATFTTDETIPFTATASDAEDGDLTALIVWTSSVDGEIGVGGQAAVQLSEGTHVITAQATDSVAQTASDAVTISVGVAPLMPPTGLRGRPRRGAIRLRWHDPNDDETGYRVERAVDAETPTFALVGSLGPNAVTFKDVALPSGCYLYRVHAARGAAVGPACEAICVRVGKRARMTEEKVPHPGTDSAEPLTDPPAPASVQIETASPDPESSAADTAEVRREVRIVNRQTVLLTVGVLNAFAELREHFRRMYEQMRRSIRQEGR